ncbi:hypothetical protein [Lamprobacter modestohalophilus]|uniref:hypothetical protein n=1 Tax=Lamprobacter modestohalophilus TaxID=1064514 RepID=UPI0019076AAF|nr:hypothetical protein [Lamprobacter modestohalophilus]
MPSIRRIIVVSPLQAQAAQLALLKAQLARRTCGLCGQQGRQFVNDRLQARADLSAGGIIERMKLLAVDEV